MFFAAHPDPDEYQRQVEEAKARGEDYSRSVKRFLSELNIEQLITLRKMVGAIRNNVVQEGGHAGYASFLEGQIVAILTHVHNVCPACGLDHDEHRLDTDCKPTANGGTDEHPTT